METLKLLPQLFYDLISRVIPGVIALVLFSHAVERDLGSLVSDPFGGAPALQDSPLFLGIATIGAAYIAGQILAPLSDLYERRIVSGVVPEGYWLFPAALRPDSPYPPAMRAFLHRELDAGAADGGSNRFTVVLFVWYDWLRVWKPEAGMRVTKLRAEYRMFGGVAVAALAAAALHLLLALAGGVQLRSWFPTVALVAATFATWGMVRTYRTFQWSVLNQYYVAKGERLSAEGAPLAPAELDAPSADARVASRLGAPGAVILPAGAPTPRVVAAPRPAASLARACAIRGSALQLPGRLPRHQTVCRAAR